MLGQVAVYGLCFPDQHTSTVVMQDTWRSSQLLVHQVLTNNNKNVDAQCLGSWVLRMESH